MDSLSLHDVKSIEIGPLKRTSKETTYRLVRFIKDSPSHGIEIAVYDDIPIQFKDD